MGDVADFSSWPDLVRAFRGVEVQLDETLRRRNDLCLTWFEVMAALEACDDPMRVSALATRVTISQPRVSRVLAAMEERGLVDRGSVAEDGRGTEVVLTERGRAEYSAAALTYREILHSSLLSQLTDAEIDSLRTIGLRLGGKALAEPGRAADRYAEPTADAGCAHC